MIKEKNKKLIFFCSLFVFLVLLFFLMPLSKFSLATVFALENDYPSFFGLTITNDTSIIEYAKYFFNLAMAVGGFLALTTMVFGGLYYLISFAGGKFIGEGTAWIKAGASGLIILLSSYLIVYSINPDLVYFRLEDLIPFFSKFQPNGKEEKKIPITFYNEIPLGVITENLVSRTRDCYDFDPEGNPIEGEKVTIAAKVIGLPTYLDKDRVDCLLKLEDGTQKKIKAIKDLSDKIINMMEQCSCQDKCSSTGGECDAEMDQRGNCGGSCAKVGCSGGTNCCPEDVKKKIEHGDIDIYDCTGNKKTYRGLDEFRSNLFSISNLIEFEVEFNEKKITVIDKVKWKNLKLAEQLMYLREKIAQIKKEIQDDKDQLEEAVGTMANCYNIESSVDFLKIKEKTKEDKKLLEINKIFQDKISKKPVEPYKYCKGFNYSNSSCFKDCQQKCPDTSPQAVSCYAKCDGKCKKDDKSCKECKEGDENCLNKKQQECVEECYDERPCPLSADLRDTNFESCISYCQDDCYDNCSKKYLPCSDQFKICQSQCQNNSKCVMENKEECLVQGQPFQKCGQESLGSDQGNIKSCIEESYLCEYGSNEYAGYPECLKEKKVNSFYPSSFLFANPGSMRCPDPYKIIKEDDDTEALCVEVYPETSKCPPSSKCPQCPCGLVNETLVFSDTDKKTCPQGECLGSDGICSSGNCDDNNDESKPLIWYSIYGHMDKINVSVGQKVERGEIIGEIGSIGTGWPHLHFAVGPARPNARNFYYIAISIDTYSEISAPGGTIGSRLPGTFPLPLPDYVTQKDIDRILSSLTNPVDMGYCNWRETLGSYLHSQDAYWAQDWQCESNDKTESAKVRVMSGGANVKSTVISLSAIEGGVLIKHEYTPNQNGEIIEKYVLVAAECSEFSYNNDPLTFYCWASSAPYGWEQEAPLFGRWSDSSLVEEIPVGRAVDNSVKWSGDLLLKIDSFDKIIGDILKHIKKIGSAKDYCQCNSVYDTGKPICKSDCRFFKIPLIDSYGDPVLDQDGNPMFDCDCSIIPCLGNPCSQMMDYLSEFSDFNKNFYKKIRDEFIDFYKYFILEERTELLKQLTYSRKTMNECSQQVVRRGEETTRTLDCTRAYENKFLNKRCYGILSSKVINDDKTIAEGHSPDGGQTDNWFCYKEALK